jgi:hypothetical protein
MAVGLFPADGQIETVVANPAGKHRGAEYDHRAGRFGIALKGEHQRMAVDDTGRGDSKAATQRSAGSSRCACVAVSHCRLSTPFARAVLAMRSILAISLSPGATISLPIWA